MLDETSSDTSAKRLRPTSLTWIVNPRNAASDHETRRLKPVAEGWKPVLSQSGLDMPYQVEIEAMEDTAMSSQSQRRRQIRVPSYGVTIKALQIYAEHLDTVQHVLHVDSVQTVVSDAYGLTDNHDKVDPSPGTFALILAICAAAGFYRSSELQLVFSVLENDVSVAKVCTAWTKEALSALDQVRVGGGNADLQATQASIILMLLLQHQEGLTFRVRMLHASSIAMARDLGLHKTDASVPRQCDTTQAAVIDREIRRKIWWHLACTDWCSIPPPCP